MKYRLTEAQKQEYMRLREELDTQERGKLMKEMEEAGAEATGFSVDALKARAVLHQLEGRILKLDQILADCEVLHPEDPADRLACELAGIKYGSFSEEGAYAETGDARISLQQRREKAMRLVQLRLQRENQEPRFICFCMDEAGGKQEYLILSKSLWESTEPEKAAAARYISLAQAAGSAYLPYLLILYYVVQDGAHADEFGIPDQNYYLDEELYRFLASCPPWLPLPDSCEMLQADSPAKRPFRGAQIPVPEDGVILRAEYGDRFGFEYQILSADQGKDEEEDPFEDDEILEEYYHLHDLLESKYLRYYLMLLSAIEQQEAPFQDL